MLRLFERILLITMFIILFFLVFNNKNQHNKSESCYISSELYLNQTTEEYATYHTTEHVRMFMVKLRPNLDSSTAIGLARAIVEASKESNVNPKYAASVAFVESSFNIGAISNKGAIGIFQVMPFHYKNSTTIDLGINASKGLKILKSCLNSAKGDCLDAYACYMYGENGYKLNLNEASNIPTMNKLAMIIMKEKINRCDSFEYY